MMPAARLFLFTHKSTVEGSSQTEQTAEHVSPASPYGPLVATTVTAVAVFESASLKSSDAIVSAHCVCRPIFSTVFMRTSRTTTRSKATVLGDLRGFINNNDLKTAVPTMVGKP
jgi:hypothetical protein